MRPYILISLISTLLIYCETENDEWISLFDGESLSGWEMKIAGYELNNNYKNTFSVKDGAIRVSYKDMTHLMIDLVIFSLQKRNLKIIT